MTPWTPATLAALRDTFSLHLAAGPAGPDAPEVEVGMVLADGDLYVRPQRGTTSRWYRAAIGHGTGRIRVSGETVAVRFEAAGQDAGTAVDAAYRSKYGELAAFAVSAPSRLATLRITPA
ncbi:DUF2255 family protein [Promicromonospora sukumoe]|uniref:DUF2255 family protein n=1 Tax=Promicromonospora sukumoe TaxID=88382 RepID=UPI0003771ACC|nr:DUF2255 family protein [Promicromonospora sukumoe]